MATPTTVVERKQGLRFRHELKYTISRLEDKVLSSRLPGILPRDRNAGPDGTYRITSLYFDTPTDTALRQKLDGVARREKFRIRYYGDQAELLRLEKKMKLGSLTAKESARLTRQEAEGILRGDIDFLLHRGEPLLTEFYSKLRSGLQPKSIVVYDREAFTYGPGNVRITLDRNVRTSLRCTDFLNPSRLHICAGEGETVLEVKYDEYLPDIVRLAVQTESRQTAYSKYAVCRRFD